MKKPLPTASLADHVAYRIWVRKQLDADAPVYSSKEERRSAHLYDRYYRIEEYRGTFAANRWIDAVANNACEKARNGKPDD